MNNPALAADPTRSFIAIRNLSVTVPTEDGAVYAVDRLNLEIGRGEIFGLIGESGSGKTMTGRALLGLTPPGSEVTAQELRIGDLDLGQNRWEDMRGRCVSMIFQDPAAALNPLATIGTQIDHVLRRHTQLDRAERRRWVLELLADVRLPEPELHRRQYPHQMSGGMQQRAMIAVALAAEPDLLIADEPTTALDVTIQAQILDLLVDLRNRRGLTILMITHDLGVVARCCDRAAVMRAGRIVEVGPTLPLITAPAHAYTQQLIDTLPGRRSATPAAGAARAIASTGDTGNHLLSVRNLRKEWRSRTGLFGRRSVVALDDVGFDMSAGMTTGLVGESGSGKTTLVRCIVGLVPPTSGAVFIDGMEIGHLKGNALREARRQIGIVYQNPFLSLSPRLDVRDLIAEPILAHNAAPRHDVNARVAALLDAVGLGRGFATRRSYQLSGGQAQRVAIARALALSPRILILDEPTSALDVSAQAQILDMLRNLKRQRSMSMLFVTHNLDVVREVAERVVVMQRGRVVETGTVERVFASPAAAYTRALIDATPTVPTRREVKIDSDRDQPFSGAATMGRRLT